jgi:hypothetical protein
MRLPAVLGAIAGALLLVPAVRAQDAAAPAPVFHRTTLVVSPASMPDARNVFRLQAAAAKAAKLPPGDVGWWAGFEGNRIIAVAPASRDALFRNTQLMQKIAAHDSAAAAAITNAAQGLRLVSATNEVFQAIPNLMYAPATPMPADSLGGWVTVEYWIAPGQRQAFDEAIRAMNEVYASVKYPYARTMAIVRMGEQRMELTTFIDSREDFYGRNSFARLTVGNAEAREKMTAARQALNKTLTNMRMSFAAMRPAMSYPPTP